MSKSMIVMLMVAVSMPGVAGQAPPAPHPAARLGALGSARPADPYRKLFDVQRGVPSALRAARPAPQPTVVCGMTIIPADPTIDPKMAVPRRSNAVDYKLRALDPPICNPAR